MPSNGNPGGMRTVLLCRVHELAEQHLNEPGALAEPQLVTLTTSAGFNLSPYLLKKELSSNDGSS